MGRIRGQQEVEGIVLMVKNYREKDKLVKLFTDSGGKKMFFVKHANRKNNPLTAGIQPFTRAIYITDMKDEGLSFLNGTKDIYPYQHIQTDIFVSAYATYIINLVDAAIEDHVYDPALFGFLKQALELLNEGYDAEIICNIFEVQLLHRFGISIDWHHCAICGETTGKFDFSSANHGVLCERHWSKDERRSHFDPSAIHFIRLFSNVRYTQINDIRISDTRKHQIRYVIDQLYDEFVGIHLKSKKFIDDMKTWEDMLKNNI
ncbi:MAG: DNA repair protein RecO [Vagococcus sp.]